MAWQPMDRQWLYIGHDVNVFGYLPGNPNQFNYLTVGSNFAAS